MTTVVMMLFPNAITITIIILISMINGVISFPVKGSLISSSSSSRNSLISSSSSNVIRRTTQLFALPSNSTSYNSNEFIQYLLQQQLQKNSEIQLRNEFVTSIDGIKSLLMVMDANNKELFLSRY